MTSFLSAMSEFFTFIFNQLTNFFNLMTSTLLGQIILGVVLIDVIIWILIYIIKSIKG